MAGMNFPVPDIHAESLRPYWLAAAQGRLELPRCQDCGAINWYPADTCMKCRSGASFEWVQMRPEGNLFSWTIVQRPLYPPYADIVPYIPVLVSLAEAPEVRIVTRLLDSDGSNLSMGQKVVFVFKDLNYPKSSTGIMAPLVVLA